MAFGNSPCPNSIFKQKITHASFPKVERGIIEHFMMRGIMPGMAQN
jgi:hypothetical protein